VIKISTLEYFRGEKNIKDKDNKNDKRLIINRVEEVDDDKSETS